MTHSELYPQSLTSLKYSGPKITREGATKGLDNARDGTNPQLVKNMTLLNKNDIETTNKIKNLSA